MLKLSNLTMKIAGKPLLEEASLVVPKGSRVGLVGPNGCGKTTLFKVISGTHSIETGTVSMARGWTTGQVAQEAPGTTEPLINIVLSADTERQTLLDEAEVTTDPDRIAQIHARLTDIEAHSAEARAATILSGLGFDQEAQRRQAASFSGGWRMRVALAAVLFARPDLLLLDEPTNYLDLEGTLWLENFLSRYGGTVVVISHDRDLLNTTCQTIVHFENRKLVPYRGNYDSFEKQRAENRELAAKTREKLVAQAAHMQAFVDRFRYKASKAKQAQSKLKAIEKLKLPAALESEGVKAIHFPNPAKISASPMMKLEGVSCGYEDSNPVLSRLNLNLDADDRIALLGANGNGKSTFAKLLSGRLQAFSGTITKSPKVAVAMFAQHQMDDLVADNTPVDHVRALMPSDGEAQVRSRVAQMGLNQERMDTKCAHLSGGEKARLLLGLCTFDGPDLLILDEPTNHLDVGAREALANAINGFKGAVILISHDRHLIDATTERLWLVHDGRVENYDGDLDSYRRMVLQSEPSDEAGSNKNVVDAPSKVKTRQKAAERRRELAPLKSRISQKETHIKKLEDAIQKLDASLATPGIFENHPEKATKFAKQRAEAGKLLEQAETEWLELEAQLEEAS